MYTCLAARACLRVTTTGEAEPGDKSKSSDGVSVKLLFYLLMIVVDESLPERCYRVCELAVNQFSNPFSAAKSISNSDNFC